MGVLGQLQQGHQQQQLVQAGRRLMAVLVVVWVLTWMPKT